MAPLTLSAITAGLLYGLAYFRTGHGPLRLTVRAILCLQATGRSLSAAGKAAAQVYRARYRESLADVIRSY